MLLNEVQLPFSTLSAKLVKRATFKVYPGGPHGVCQTQPDMVNRDLLAFIKGQVS